MYIMLARQGGKDKYSKDRLEQLNAGCRDEAERALHFVKSNLRSICELFGLDIDGDVLIIGDRKYFVHLLRGTVVEIKTKEGYYGK